MLQGQDQRTKTQDSRTQTDSLAQQPRRQRSPEGRRRNQEEEAEEQEEAWPSEIPRLGTPSRAHWPWPGQAHANTRPSSLGGLPLQDDARVLFSFLLQKLASSNESIKCHMLGRASGFKDRSWTHHSAVEAVGHPRELK